MRRLVLLLMVLTLMAETTVAMALHRVTKLLPRKVKRLLAAARETRRRKAMRRALRLTLPNRLLRRNQLRQRRQLLKMRPQERRRLLSMLVPSTQQKNRRS